MVGTSLAINPNVWLESSSTIRNIGYLFQIGCQGNMSYKLCGEARPELLAFNCSVVQLEFQSDTAVSFAGSLAGFRLMYNIYYSPSAGKVHGYLVFVPYNLGNHYIMMSYIYACCIIFYNFTLIYDWI